MPTDVLESVDGLGVSRAAIEEQLSRLKADLVEGDGRLRQLDEQRGTLRDQLLRIDGAIRALSELIGPAVTDSSSTG
jgi:hypothetical protein